MSAIPNLSPRATIPTLVWPRSGAKIKLIQFALAKASNGAGSATVATLLPLSFDRNHKAAIVVVIVNCAY